MMQKSNLRRNKSNQFRKKKRKMTLLQLELTVELNNLTTISYRLQNLRGIWTKKNPKRRRSKNKTNISRSYKNKRS